MQTHQQLLYFLQDDSKYVHANLTYGWLLLDFACHYHKSTGTCSASWLLPELHECMVILPHPESTLQLIDKKLWLYFWLDGSKSSLTWYSLLFFLTSDPKKQNLSDSCYWMIENASLVGLNWYLTCFLLTNTCFLTLIVGFFWLAWLPDTCLLYTFSTWSVFGFSCRWINLGRISSLVAGVGDCEGLVAWFCGCNEVTIVFPKVLDKFFMREPSISIGCTAIDTSLWSLWEREKAGGFVWLKS